MKFLIIPACAAALIHGCQFIGTHAFTTQAACVTAGIFAIACIGFATWLIRYLAH